MTSKPGPRSRIFRALVNRTSHACFFRIRALTLGMRTAVRSEDGKLLLLRHSYTASWHIPEGDVEKGGT